MDQFLMKEILFCVWEESIQIESVTKVEKGFSADEKWRVNLIDREPVFVRVISSHRKKNSQWVYSKIEKLCALGIPTPTPIRQFELPDGRMCQINSYIKGEDLDEILLKMTDRQQRELGYQSGMFLRQIHESFMLDGDTSWNEMRMTKHERYLEAARQLEKPVCEFDSADYYIRQNAKLMKGRPITFLHDDYHPANLRWDGQLWILDFDRAEWGDPYHDFIKIALFTRNISIPFSIGQVQGYFQGEPPEDFWSIYTLYVAMVVLSDLVWSVKHTPHLLQGTKQRLQQILHDHNNFQTTTPAWYQPYNI